MNKAAYKYKKYPIFLLTRNIPVASAKNRNAWSLGKELQVAKLYGLKPAASRRCRAGWSAIRANSSGPMSRCASESGLRTLGSGSCDPSARAAAVRIEVREGSPLASIQELSGIAGGSGRWGACTLAGGTTNLP